jgi:hypothetical protein
MTLRKSLSCLMVCLLINLTIALDEIEYPYIFGATEGAPSESAIESNQRNAQPNAAEIARDIEENSGDREDLIAALSQETRPQRAGYAGSGSQNHGGGVSATQARGAIQKLQSFSNPQTWGGCCGFGNTWNARNKFCSSHGIGKVGCHRMCNWPMGNTPCWYSRPVLCIDDQGIKRPRYLHDTPASNNGWAGGYLMKSKWRIPGCWLKWFPWLGDWICRWSAGSCWRMARNTDGAYRQTNAQQPDHCTWNWPETTNSSMSNFYAHGDFNGAINSDEYWVGHRGKNCWDRQPWCQWGPDIFSSGQSELEQENTAQDQENAAQADYEESLNSFPNRRRNRGRSGRRGPR